MNRLLLRIVALLLAPCLVIDTAAGAQINHSVAQVNVVFTHEAIVSPLVEGFQEGGNRFKANITRLSAYQLVGVIGGTWATGYGLRHLLPDSPPLHTFLSGMFFPVDLWAIIAGTFILAIITSNTGKPAKSTPQQLWFMEHLKGSAEMIRARIVRLLLSNGVRIHDAEDIAQETILIAIEKIDQLDDREKREAWMNSIARNLMSMLHRKFDRFVPLPDELNPKAQLRASGLDPEEKALRSQILEEIAYLHPRDRYVLRASLDDLSMKHIGDKLGLSESGAKTLLHRAKKALRKRVTKSSERLVSTFKKETLEQGQARMRGVLFDALILNPNLTISYAYKNASLHIAFQKVRNIYNENRIKYFYYSLSSAIEATYKEADQLGKALPPRSPRPAKIGKALPPRPPRPAKIGKALPPRPSRSTKNSLPDNLKQIVDFSHNGLGIRQIASQLGISLAQVKIGLYQAKNILKASHSKAAKNSRGRIREQAA